MAIVAYGTYGTYVYERTILVMFWMNIRYGCSGFVPYPQLPSGYVKIANWNLTIYL